jgi:hypothetical protein
MPRFSGKQTDVGVPVTIDRDRYTEGDVVAAMEGNVSLGEKPGNVVFPVQIDADGNLKVITAGGVVEGHEYQDGAVNTNAYGRLILGDDGANLQNILVDSSGRLQVEVVQGQYDGVQYQDGAAVASPFGTVALGHDGSNVFPVTVDASGHIQVDVVGALPSGSAAIGKLAANSGVDIGDVTLTAGSAKIGAVDVGKCSTTQAQIVVNISTATTTVLKAASAGHTYTIMSIVLTVAAANNLTWKSATTAISGPMDFGETGEPHGMTVNLWPCGLGCVTGEALQLTTTTTGQVSGFITILDES